MKLSSLDRALAEAYAPALLKPVKYGENGVFFWFPGSGMTTIVQDICAQKRIWQKQLAGLAGRQKVWQLWGHVADERSAAALVKGGGFADWLDMKNQSDQMLKEGKEVVVVVGRIDNYSQRERLAALKQLLKLCSVNRRRVHVLFQSVDKPWFEQMIVKHPELMALANRMEIMPVVKGSLLSRYVRERAEEYGFRLSTREQQKVERMYGGILQLTKEYLRMGGGLINLELKVRNIWNCLPDVYRKEVEKRWVLRGRKTASRTESDLEKFGVAGLKVFSQHWAVLDNNPEQLLPKFLTGEELELWEFCRAHSGQLLDKEVVAGVLRPGKAEQVSLWAVDQAVSRYRRKLARVGIDPEKLKTVKGKGYIWQL